MNARMPATGRLLILVWMLGAALRGWSAAAPDFSEDFSKLPLGKLPDIFLILDGQFAVREEGLERFVELPGDPLESFGVMFGPAKKENWAAKARIRGTGQRRRFPVFGLSLNGVSGYRVQVVPVRKSVELLKGDEIRASAPLNWENGTWTQLRIQVRKAANGGWVVEGKAWKDGTPEPAAWMVTSNETDEPVSGRAAVWGKPFSGTPIQFDDFEIRLGIE